MRPMESFTHDPLLYNSTSRLKATRNDTILSISNIRSVDHTMITNLSQLTPRAIVSMASCAGLQEFQTQGDHDDDDGDTCPTIERMLNTVSEGIV